MTSCDFDWGVASKFIPLITSMTTILVAFFVYHIWHEQKAKEVMATEAKQCIKDLLEMIKIINYINIGKYKDEELNIEFSKFKVLFEQSIINLMYIDDCVKISNFKNKIYSYSELGNSLIKLKSNNSPDYKNANFLEKVSEDAKYFSTDAMEIVNLLRPYSVYRKTFKFKD